MKLKLCVFLCLLICQISAHDKWIVVTTINYPSKALEKLATLTDWKLVVVGDKKTPKDWHLENCIYLSEEKQLELGYDLVNLLPWNHYCRKNIGYLYVIQNGAKVIYETDDDNELIDDILLLDDKQDRIQLNSHSKAVNVYAYFGQESVWPRGFPLSSIMDSNQFSITTSDTSKKIGIIQGLVNKDPDVDAIYRLTQGKEVYFQDKLPCVLDVNSYCPFNTQNTVYYEEAFWGLYVPTTTPFRVCDIWRGYFVQRLLWDLNLHVCFTSPTAVQERNEHNFFHDFCDELELYLYSDKLIDFLTKWKNDSSGIADRYQHLILDLIENEYLKPSEEQLFRAWISDLRKVGYQFTD